MITARTKRQLIAFALITLLGVSYVGARYAKLDRLFYDATYEVNAHYLQSGGIFDGAEVTYRGVGVGQVSELKLTKKGVDVVLAIERDFDKIPADSFALVGNKSAVGEQYVELQPRVDKGPYLKDGSEIDSADTAVPVPTKEVLTNLDALVNSVPQDDLRTVVSELGAAFYDAGPDLGQIIDTSSSFIETANQNFDVTSALIRDSRTVLGTQVDKGSAIRSFARDLELFSGTLAASDKDLRAVIDSGSATANELRSFLEANQVDLGSLINNLVTTNQIVVKRLPGIRQILVAYPHVVASGYTVAANVGNGNYNARFGLILQQSPPVCLQGYEAADRRPPRDTSDRPMNTKVGCTAGPGSTNARGAQNAPRAGADYAERPGTEPIATYDAATGALSWADEGSPGTVVYDGGARQVLGEDSWKWMLLQPALDDPPAG